MGVPGRKETRDEVPQVLRRADPGPAPALPAQDREPNLHLVEPRAVGWQPGEGDLRALGRAPVPHGLRLLVAGSVHTQVPVRVGVTSAPGAQEVAKLQVGMALLALGKDCPRAPVQGGKESDRTVAHICKFLALNQARPQGQRRGQALQGWDAGLLIETQHATVAWGVQIEGANLRPLLLKPGVGAGPAVAQALGGEHQGGQNPLDGGRTPGQDFPAPCHQAGQIPHAVMGKAPQLPLRRAWAGHGDDGVAGQRGKPRRATRPGQILQGAETSCPLPLPGRAGEVPEGAGQSACATSAPECARCPRVRALLIGQAVLGQEDAGRARDERLGRFPGPAQGFQVRVFV